ncbi:MAG: peptide-methionine (S)-S-oxide reductase MsrA [Actinomycetota bacterium]
MESFVLGGGCFWCLDSSFMQFRGIQDVIVGYSGGHKPKPSYEEVCSESTGHAEVAKVNFDPAIIPAEIVLDIFFTLHDPTQLNRQGNDVGESYRSCMFYEDEAQREVFSQALERAKKIWGDSVVTSIEPLGEFWVAEEYHQDFFQKNPFQSYCNFVVKPKMEKTAKTFNSYLR